MICYNARMTTFGRYIQAALRRATYDFDTETGVYVAHIPELAGVYAQAKTIETAREELAEVVEEWVLLGVQCGDVIPSIGGVTVRPMRQGSRMTTHA